MKRGAKAAILAAMSGLTLLGCQFVSGLNELEVEEEPNDTDDTSDDSASDETSSTQGETSTSEGCSIPNGLECAPSNNCGCDEDEICALADDDGDLTVKCQTPGKATEGDFCEIGDCGSGLLCVRGICTSTCRFKSDCEADEATCVQVQRPNGEPLNGVRYCQQNCDLVSPEDPEDGYVACSDEQSCHATATGSSCVNEVGEGDDGDECKTSTECDAGYTCQSGHCAQWCYLADPDCPAGYLCEAGGEASPALDAFGVCEGGCPATIPPGDECLTEPNCGCPSGETCRATEGGKRSCSATGEGGPQSACESNADCGAELACIGGLCRPYCDLEDEMCSTGGDCIQVLYGDSALEGVGACLGSCDPVDPNNTEAPYTPCGEGAECEVGFADSEYTTSHCIAANPLDVGTTGPCAEDYSCGEGATCIYDRCFPLCREDENCDGITETGTCIDADLGYFAAPGDSIGLCCSPTPVEGSTCSAFILECGCAPGYTCRSAVDEDGYYYYDGHTVCSPVGETEEQARCFSDDECAAGTSCIGYPVGLCRPHCDGACEGPRGACAQVTLEDEPLPFAQVCLGRCDPVTPSRQDADVAPCGEGGHCAAGWAGEEDPASGASFCVGEIDDPAAVGGTCTFDDECASGLACDLRDCTVVGDVCQGLCVRYCYDAGDCEPGGSCNLDVGRVLEPDTAVGYCEYPSNSPDASSN